VSRGEARFLHVANALVGVTGLVWAWMLWLVEPEDPYALVNHPLQPAVQHLHVIAAPIFVFAAGLVWRGHVWAGITSPESSRRASGLSLAGTLLPMVATGYLMQVAVDPAWRKVWVAGHVATSGLWIAAYLVHQARTAWLAVRARVAG
jgi:hypothetical protein